jgi:LysM repeat protein
MSLGGYGTFDFAGKYASQISAAMALCGGGKVKYANNLATIPLWIMHGKADRAVPYSQSLEMERAIKNSSDTNYTRASYFAGLDHADMVHVFYMPQMYQWLYQFDKTQTNKTKINNFDITLSDFRKRPIDGEFGAFGKELKAKEEPNYQPPTQTETKVEPSAPKVQSKQAPRIHIVKQGDTLYQLSKKYHTTIEKLCRNNGIKENAILKIGQKIKLD